MELGGWDPAVVVSGLEKRPEGTEWEILGREQTPALFCVCFLINMMFSEPDFSVLLHTDLQQQTYIKMILLFKTCNHI